MNQWSLLSRVQLLRSHGLQPTRLLHPWNFPGKSTGVGCHFLLQGIFPSQISNPGLLHCRWMFYCLRHQGSVKNYNPSKMQQVVHTFVSVNCTGDWNLLSFQRWHWECQYYLLTLNSAQVGRGPGLWPAVCPGAPTASPVTWEDISLLARITQPRAASWSVSHMAHSLQGHEPLLPASTTRPHFLPAFFGFYSPCIF